MLREFRDPHGKQWRVWDVNPLLHRRRPLTRVARTLNVPAAWLCFECDDERRRLSPIPVDWETGDEALLQQLLSTARLVPITAS
jgi:hypothetical protein